MSNSRASDHSRVINSIEQCALFQADNRLAKIEQGTRIRVQGDLASRYFGNNSKPSALVSTWIIYMDVDEVEVLRQ